MESMVLMLPHGIWTGNCSTLRDRSAPQRRSGVIQTQVKQNPTGAPVRAFLDEAGFQQLLAAAFVVQQHNERLRLVKGPGAAYTKILSEIVETEGQIRNGRLNLSGALRLIVERARKLTRADGAAIALLDGNHLLYRATSGRCSDEVGSRAKLNSALAGRCLRTGSVLHSSDTNTDRNLDAELCWSKGVRSLIAAPILYKGRPVGVLELRFGSPNGFREEDVRTCELTAGLVALAVSNEWDTGRQKLLASRDDSAMTQAIEKFTPQMAKILDDPDFDFAEAGAALSGKIVGDIPPASAVPNENPVREIRARETTATQKKEAPVIEGLARGFPVREIPARENLTPEAGVKEAGTKESFTKDILARSGAGHEILAQGVLSSEVLMKGAASAAVCQNCGREFVADELLCGTCGTERRPQPTAEPSQQAGTWVSLWDLQENQAEEKNAKEPAAEPGNASSSPGSAPSILTDAQENRTSFLEGLHEFRSRFLNKQEATEEKLAAAVPEVIGPKSPRHESPSVDTPQAQTPHGAPSALEEFQRRFDEEEKPAAELSSFAAEEPEASAEAETLPWTEHPRIKRIHEFWEYHRATIYLALAAILLLMVLLNWADPPVSSAASANPQTASAAGDDLTMLDKLLINMGLAEAPPAPGYMGNPQTKVWVDVHTALYYCPGADLFGKTKGGRYETQKDAQQDAFEPAANRACR